MSFINNLRVTSFHKVEAFTRMIKRDYAKETPFFRKNTFSIELEEKHEIRLNGN